jgi:hypothetical protein
MQTRYKGKLFHPVFLGVFFVAMATLCLEVILTRIFSFSIWYHFSYLTINIALLGFGSSGAILAAYPAIIKKERWKIVVILCTIFCAVSTVTSLLIFARHPLQPQTFFITPLRFSFTLILYYIGVSLPFFFAGSAIAISLAIFSEKVSQLYFWDLCGAAVGALLSLLLMNKVGAPGGILVCTAILLGASCCFATLISKRISLVIGLITLTVFILIPYVKDTITIVPCSSKVLSKVFKNPDKFKLLFTEWNEINRVDVYESLKDKYNPFVHLTVSHIYSGSYPDFYYMQYDGHNGSNILHFTDDLNEYGFLDYSILKIPYLLLERPKVLVIGVGGGIDVFNAYKNNASSITAVELQPIAVKILKGHFSKWVGNIFNKNSHINLIPAEGRNFINSSREQFDLIQITVTDTFAAINTGAYLLMESYIYTENACSRYFDHLTENGVLCIIPGDHVFQGSSEIAPLNTRLVLEFLNVLQSKGVKSPLSHIAVIGMNSKVPGNNMGYAPLLKKTPFTEQEMQKIRSFVSRMGFSIVFDPLAHNKPENILSQILTTHGIERERILEKLPYNVTPCTDDNPFFYNFIKWNALIDLFNQKKFIFYTPVFGQAVLLFLFFQSIIFSFICIILPLLVSKSTTFPRACSLGYLFYFASLGIGFMFIEISFIQKFVLFLGYPAYAFAITFFALLLFSGIGSYWTSKIAQKPEALLKQLIFPLACIIFLYTVVLDTIFDYFMGERFTIKVLLTVLIQMPLGSVLGMFFPLGIKLIHQVNPRMVPWAWSVNAMSSVVSTIGAILIAMCLGFKFVSYLSILVYLFGITSMLITAQPRLVENKN